MALSPDGRLLAFTAGPPDEPSRLWVRALDRLDATPLAGTEGAHAPFFSPDGQSLAFFSDEGLRKIPVEGGAPLTLDPETTERAQGTWGADGTIVYNRAFNSGLHRIPASGGVPVELTTTTMDISHRWPSFLPNGRVVLFVSGKASGGTVDDWNIEALSLDTGERTIVHRGGTFPRYAASGHLLFARGGLCHPLRRRTWPRRGRAQPDHRVRGRRLRRAAGLCHLRSRLARVHLLGLPGCLGRFPGQ